MAFDIVKYFEDTYSGNLKLTTGYGVYIKSKDAETYIPFVAHTIPDLMSWQVGEQLEIQNPGSSRMYMEGKFAGEEIDFTAYYLSDTFKKIKALKGQIVTLRADYGEAHAVAFEVPVMLSVGIGETSEDGAPLTMVMKARQCGELNCLADTDYVALEDAQVDTGVTE